VYGLAAPLAGIVVDRARRKTVILGGLHAWSVICLATVVSRNFTHLFLFRAAEGLGETFYFPASTSMLSDYHGSLTRSRALGLHQTAVYMGTIGGGFFAGLIAEAYGWRWSFVVFGGLGVLLGVVLTRFLVEPPRGAADAAEGRPARLRAPRFGASRDSSQAIEGERRRKGYEKPPLGFGAFLRLVGRTPTLLCLLGAFMCANFVAVVLLSWMPKFLYDRFHMGLAMSGLTATVFVQLASMVGAPVGGWLADLWRRRSPRGRMAVQTVGVLGGAPFVVLCGMTTSVATLVVSLTLWGFFKGLYDANIFASAFDVVPFEARGRTAGFMNMIGWLAGGGSAPLAIGVIAERTSLGAALALASLVYVAAAALLIAGMMMVKQGDAVRSVSAS
jgi:MFS family permease